MKNVKLYRTENKMKESEDVVFATAAMSSGDHMGIELSGNTSFELGGEKYLILQNVDLANDYRVINSGNQVHRADYYTTSLTPIYIPQPMYLYWETEEIDGVYFCKFEETSDEPVEIHYSIGGGKYATKNAMRGTLTLVGGRSFENIFLAPGTTDNQVEFWSLDYEEGGNIYVGGNDSLFEECPYIDRFSGKYGMVSVTPGIGYCGENKNVLYNGAGKWEGVTLTGNGYEKTYTSNIISLAQFEEDYGPTAVGIRGEEGTDFFTIGVYEYFVFPNSSSGKTFWVMYGK